MIWGRSKVILSDFYFVIKTYAETLDYLYQTLPIFQRVGAVAYKADLTNTLLLCEALGNPQQKFKSIHIGGTNGKGSSSHMSAAILQEAGYKTGLYTSPHLKEFTERIKINGQEVEQEFVVNFVNRIQSVIEKIQPSFFELTVAMAFDYFAKQLVDVAVVEVGLGGRLDSTNIIAPEISLITNISFDHMDLLGNTLEKIAFEKAGIIKSGIPVVVSERQSEIESVFIRRAECMKSPIYFATDEIRISREFDIFHRGELWLKNLNLQLKGLYQRKNLPGVLSMILHLRGTGFNISDTAIRQGFEKVITLTGLKGRWQQLGDKPLTICDTGHNEEGIREVVNQIALTPHEHLHFVLGVVKEKDLAGIMQLLPHNADYYFCQARIPRALDAKVLAEAAGAAGLFGKIIPDVNEAIREAKKFAGTADLIFIGGSTFVVAEIEGL